ncbi:unnamed protein product [Rotaria magnacalcarata]|uniref:Uncharacterized protein n=2 Tax=Rotaria magnacalcarata TaxID=392030 RepID=A0A814HIB1_9BILA|nr:unnamed protein product [Rotaria magnacalcarata]CAF1953307.1 unnamed protein product [Rotaria magnacalcarata]CAF3997084.1 unnamed protein product [Rotaria magnacalcarata]CAF4484341.1 unnamed protein product [Rotaria magnacalcarata]CAF4536238.1 unnamed protein product [Rotaria magnacalcarata]
MSLLCAIETCKRKLRALCHCCNKNLCPGHLKEHVDLINSRMNPLADEINTLDNQLSLLNVDEIIDKYRQKLDKWRHECDTTIDRFCEEKCQELQKHCVEKAIINDIKRDINRFEENGIVVDADPLIINKNLVYIEQWTSNELDLSTLSSLFRVPKIFRPP